jgi:cellulose synthase/poly-beta-1,6-N-acetylglucosamine synthase-like glycosyltransferase
MLAEYTFWALVLLVAHTYLLYPCVLMVAYSLAQLRKDFRYLGGRRDRRRRSLDTAELPGVSLIIPAYNEEAHLPDTLANLRLLDYPRDRLQIICVSDASTDRTNDILAGTPALGLDLEVVLLPVRSGKAGALNAAVARARHDVVVFADASTLFRADAIQRLVRHFADPSVGVVCGALRFQGGGDYRHTEGAYWKYESMLRLMEGRLGATLTASGAIYAIRRCCYRELSAEDVIDDFLIPMHARSLGFRVVYDPEAEAVEFAAAKVKDEFTRRVRLAVGSFNALSQFLRTPMPGFTLVSFISHKFLRWVLPLLMIGLLVTNAMLLERPFYQALFTGQLLFYGWAALGYIGQDRLRNVPYGLLPYFLVAIHAAFLLGLVRFVFGRQTAAWKRVSS